MARGIIISILILLGLTTFAVVLSLVIKSFYSRSRNTRKSIIPELLELFSLVQGDVFADLGAGDFRVVFGVARRFKEQSVGYEISPILLLVGKIHKIFNIRSASDVQIEAKSLFLADIAEFDVIYLNLDQEILEHIMYKISNEAKEGTRVFVLDKECNSMDPHETHTLSSNQIVREYILKK